ncbi:Sensory box histidine kinase/response regulator [Labilithrix luteola]|uniref:histidine kinase n=1 Tax=Labilithrix luteola TaxID=1391654 RepID=A0A0K1PUJ7_9BACT|nr:ATP-binding protein [Labilithrix luteola]AKU97051.1 Sensory box histidine kinase/response regulator [Labilithrix luteola]
MIAKHPAFPTARQEPKRALRVLLVEDSEADAELVVQELSRAGFEVEAERVMTRANLERALERTWDVIVSDYSLPDMDAPAVLDAVRRRGEDVPFVLVSGELGEELAAHAMKLGAHDCLTKRNLRRLGPVVVRELAEHRARAERRRVEETRRQAEEGFRVIVENCADLVIVHRAGHILYANPQAVRVLGYDDGAIVVGKALSSFQAPRCVLRTEADDPPAPSDPGRAAAVEELWRRRDGSLVAVDVLRHTVIFEGERATVDLARDMTKRNQLAASMVEMDRMATIGTLAAGVAHEINNPLAYVLANLEFISAEIKALVEELPSGANERSKERAVDLQQALADAIDGAGRVRDAVKDLRTFSRGAERRHDAVDVHKVLDSALRMAAVQLRQRTTTVRDYGDVPPVRGDESSLGQVFLNLIIDAAHAMSEGTPTTNRLELRTRLEGGYVIVEVSDTGRGIPREELPRLFDPFLPEGTREGRPGFGLAVGHRIVNSLGGDIAVESELGRGTKFTVRLPSRMVAGERPPPPRRSLRG